MKLAIASDHGGFELKQEIIKYLNEMKIDYVDLGNEGTDSVDYPDYAEKVAELVSNGEAGGGILVCGTGIGMAMVANKFKNVRAAVVHDPFTARMAKEHNNANIICLGGRVTEPAKAKGLVRTWLETTYEGGRHKKRLEKISDIDKRNLR